MENIININEYVRLDDGTIGIVKYIDTQNIGIITNNNEIEVSSGVVSHSSNIIDLIEVGDYVNGHLVVDIYTDLEDFGDGCTGIEVESDLQVHKLLTKKHIKSIVTKEQFENAEYRLED